MFVSANAVRCFFDQKPTSSLVFSGDGAIKTRAWATGPGTAAALLAAGVAPHLIDSPHPQSAQLDSEALWQVVGPRVEAGQRVLIVRGRDRDRAPSEESAAGTGREWLAEQLRAVGACPEFVVAYERGAPAFNDEEQAMAVQAARDGSLWLFSSAEAIANLGSCLPGVDWAVARALATHIRIAAAARNLGFGEVRESRAGFASVLASIKSL
jgi:uroporphyrinogen-III synthase